jgi:hypothetical protein
MAPAKINGRENHSAVSLSVMSPQDLLNRLHDEPFKRFRVRLTNNTTIDITDPGLVIVGPTSAVMPIQTAKDDLGYTLVTQWRTIALSHMMEFADIEPPKGSRKKSA